MLSFLTSFELKGQSMNFVFSKSAGTYTALSGGTSWQSGATLATNAVSSAVMLPFTFVYNGTACDRIYISNNGFITLGNSSSTTAPTATTYNPISATTAYVGAIAGYGFNLVNSGVSGAAPDISYGSSGFDFVVQFTDLGRTGVAGDRMSFQIRLTQTTNVVSIVYNNTAATTTTTAVTNFGVTGLRGGSNSFFNTRMVSASSPYNSWTNSGASGDNGTAATQTADDNTGGINTMRYNNLYLPANGLTYTWTPVSSSFYQSLPYSQNFDSWSSSGAVNDLPATTGVINWPASGNRSWRNITDTAANGAWTNLTGQFTGTQAGAGAATFNQYNATAASNGTLDFYLNFSTVGTKQAVFYIKNPGGTNANDVVKVYLSTDGGVSFLLLQTYASPMTTWTQQTLSLGTSTNANCVLRFEGISDWGSLAENLAIDELNISVPSICATPNAPTALSLTTASAGSITGAFTSSSPVASGYVVVRSTNASLSANPVDGTTYTTASTIGGGNIISVGAGLTIADSSLASNTKYYYYVFAYNNTSCSGGPKYSASLNNNATGQVTCAATPTAAVTPVTSITSGSATINWVASVAGGSAGTINYTVEVYTDSGYTAPITGSPFSAATSTSRVITFSNAAITYYYRIKANNGSCDSAYLTGSFVPACSAPASLAASATVSAAGVTSVAGSFTTTSGTPVPTGYVVIRSTSSSLPTLSAGTTYAVGANAVVATNGYVEYVGTAAGSWTSTALSGGATYYYFVFSYNNTSCSSGPLYSTAATQINMTTSVCPTFSSVISIGGGTTTSGSLYPTLTAALADLVSCGMTQPTILSINGSYTSASEIFPIVIPSIAGSSTVNTLTIKPASGVSPVISGAAASNPLIKINGGSNVIIDGSNTAGGTTKDLSLTNTATTTPNVVVIGSPDTTPVSNVVLKNTVVTNGSNTSSAVLVSSSATVGSAGYFKNISIQNNSIRKAFNGLFVVANTASGNGDGLLIAGNDLSATGANSIRHTGIYIEGVDGATVRDNTIGNISNANLSEYPTGIWLAAGTNKALVFGNTISSVVSTYSGDASAAGIYILSGSTASAVDVFNNTISGISSYGTYVDGSVGIESGSSTANVNVYSNKISNVKNLNTGGYGAAGIFLGSSSATASTSLYNNMIWDVAAYGYVSAVGDNGHGLYVGSGAGYKIYFNSINMTTNQTIGVGSAFYVDGAITNAGALDVRNNIFANNQTANTRYSFYSGAAKTVYGNINNNDYYSTGILAYLGAARTTLAALQATTGTGQDANSLNIIPSFISPTNLLMPSTVCSVLVNAGTPITGITTDIQNEMRSVTAPDMGADEFAGNIPPKVATVAGGSSCGAGVVVLGATGTSAGTLITEYRLYTASAGGTLVATSSTGTINTPPITATTNYYVATYNGCESETRTLVTATVNPTPTDIVLTPTISPVAADACGLDYVKLEATGGLMDAGLQYSFGTQASQNTATTSSAGYPAPYTVFYGGQKMQMLIKASELTAAGYSNGSKINNIQFPVVSKGSNWGGSLTANKDFQVSIGNTALNALTTTFQTGLTQVVAPADFIPTVGYNNTHPFNTPFVWNGTSNIIIETTFSNNMSGVANDLVTQYYSPTSYVSTAVYRVDGNTSAAVASATTITTSTNGFVYNARPDFKLNGSNTTQSITWSPAAGLYTDMALTVPYVSGASATTLYAAPTDATGYTAKATQGTCEKLVTTASIQRLKKEFRGPGTDWNTAANWFPAQVPDNGKCASVPATQNVIVSSNAEVKSITIAATGKITITAANSLTVTDAIDITNNAANDNLVLQSDANLLQINPVANSGKMLAKRNVHMRRADYTYWSSPVKDQVLLNTINVNASNSSGGFSEGSPNNRTFQYNESDDKFYATTDAQFLDAKGYAIRGKSIYDPSVLTEDTDLKFVGVPNNGSRSINIKKSPNTGTGGTIEHGYNLIGNPYPSNIDFVKFFYLGNNSDVINAKAWFWSNVAPSVNQAGASYGGNNYATITLAGGVPPTTTVTSSTSTGSYIPSKNIKVGQAFMVQAKNMGTNQALIFDNTIRTNEAGVFFNNKGSSDVNRYWLMLTTPENIVNTILVAYLDGATNNYDANYDADILTIGDDSFYAKLNSQKLQIQAKSNPLAVEDVVPLGTKYANSGVYKIGLGGREGIFEEHQKIYLFDKLNNLYTDLTTQDYIFTANKGTDVMRFEIVYKNKEVLATDGTGKSDFKVYRDGDCFVVSSSQSLGKVELYDASGRLIITRSANQKELRLDVTSVSNGVYIIKAENSGNVKTKKILK